MTNSLENDNKQTYSDFLEKYNQCAKVSIHKMSGVDIKYC